MRIKGSALILASAVAILVGSVLLDGPFVHAQTPAAQPSPSATQPSAAQPAPSRPAPVVVPQGTPPPPRPSAAAPTIAPRAPKPGERQHQHGPVERLRAARHSPNGGEDQATHEAVLRQGREVLVLGRLLHGWPARPQA